MDTRRQNQYTLSRDNTCCQQVTR